ncbi:CCR4-NOT transcription complex subunit 6-like-B isoform X4 [Limulus polyphemus]|uniref:CCR4-NOT transcription complex subunit 6-like-B isoform X4 n=1 Tax=Limulus polyphemus TaxID=6850 RepID=A0ABM1T7R0_LIMPO|nr:CCR4-NOT transcription complex subunit 6-like-B isoform X4 [Limulus polyphemus]
MIKSFVKMIMSLIFHCYEFLLLKRLEEDPSLWREIKKQFSQGKSVYILQSILPDLWFLAITLEKTKDRFPAFVKAQLDENLQLPSRQESLLGRYLNSVDFVELHLDSIFKHGENGYLPQELFRCPNVKLLSLKYNLLETVPPDIGHMKNLEYLALTNNRLQNFSIPYTLTFCQKLSVLLLDNNLLDALPGFLCYMPSLHTVHRHGNHNYFKATFMWYHTDVNERIMFVSGSGSIETQHKPERLQFLAARVVIAAKINFYSSPHVPHILMDYISDMYFNFNICGNCPSARLLREPAQARLHTTVAIQERLYSTVHASVLHLS